MDSRFRGVSREWRKVQWTFRPGERRSSALFGALRGRDWQQR
jgi:hypothetical protein